MKDPVDTPWAVTGNNGSDPSKRAQTVCYFILTVLGFSFWFLTVVPFASHRESYSWLAGVKTASFAHEFSFGLSSTYRPLAQVATSLEFLFLDPHVFPTNVLRQGLLQGLIYGMFVLAWWFIYSSVRQRRVFALIACLAGGVFFSGYIHLFHLYGLFYVPVMLTLGALLYCHSSNTFAKHEAWFAAVATVLALWHPFATALFVGFYFGFYLDTFRQRNKSQHVRALVIVLVGIMAIVGLVMLFPRDRMPLNTKLLGFLVSYETNEVNWVASFVAFVLSQIAVFSMELPPKLKVATVLLVSGLGGLLVLRNLPILLLWLVVVLIKLVRLRCWSIVYLTLTAALLPFGGGIGTPIYALFAIILAAYATALGWDQAEEAVSIVKSRYVLGTVVAAMMVVLMVRVGLKVPIVTKLATPLFVERERTYQLENILGWLHSSDYCGYEVAFVNNAGSPIDDVEGAITRRNRPPAAIGDVKLFWDTVLQCHNSQRYEPQTAFVVFGGPPLADLNPVFKVEGRYAGDAIVWVGNSKQMAGSSNRVKAGPRAARPSEHPWPQAK